MGKPRFRLAAVLRARMAQEDVARAAVARARGDARSARETVSGKEGTLAASQAPTGGTALAVVAALAARRALAEDLAAARHDVTIADVHTDERLADLAEAAKRRRVVEKLAERQAAERAAMQAAADQAAIDEIAVTAAARKGGRR